MKKPKQNISKEDMEQGLRELKIGDLLFDPWFGFGLILAVDSVQLNCDIKFYDKREQKFSVEKEAALFLKRNINLLINANTKEDWKDMYCIF